MYFVIHTACKRLAKLWGLFLGTSHFDFEVWQNMCIFYGGVFPLELQIS